MKRKILLIATLVALLGLLVVALMDSPSCDTLPANCEVRSHR